jgi:FkbM family methyltransferase
VDFNYTKIKAGNWLFRYCFPLYNILYRRFKLKNDADEIALLQKLVKPGSVVLDIGANIGFYARVISPLCGNNGIVYCFEPDKGNFERLRKNVADLENVRIFNAAVSNNEGTLKVYRSKLLNVDHRTYPVENYESIETTEALSIDGLLNKKTIRVPDVIKIDIQGYELTAFMGMKRLLSEVKSLNILAEYWPHGFRRAGTAATEFFDFFDALGYRFSVIRGKELIQLKRDEVVANNEQPFEFSFNVLIEKK